MKNHKNKLTRSKKKKHKKKTKNSAKANLSRSYKLVPFWFTGWNTNIEGWTFGAKAFQIKAIYTTKNFSTAL